MSVVTVCELKPSAAAKKPFRTNSITKHTAEWPVSDVSGDLAIQIGTASFLLHKFPLIARSGRIRKQLMEVKNSKVSRINLPSVPGGSEAFELAAKFCYGFSVEITLLNIAMLRCAAYYLEMSEEFAEKNLENQTEAFLKETVFSDISSSITVLHHCESLWPVSEEINLINRLVIAIADNACKEQLSFGLSKLEQAVPGSPTGNGETELSQNWWGRSLTVLNLEFFRRVVTMLKSKGLKHDLISKILINYANESLQSLVLRDQFGVEKKQRNIVETIVGLLPTQPKKTTSVPIVFLSSLLKHAIAASASSSCRSELERRIGLQLDQAILEDILIPTNSNGISTYEIDSITRIFSIFLNLEEDDAENLQDDYDDAESPESPKQSSILNASKLLDNFLAEIALDRNLNGAKFISLAEILPEHARSSYDGLYRAVDIFLKVHPNIKESDRYRLCKSIDCQKLSQEACSHAAQNERLPVQTAVQVLYFEQIRLRNAMSGGQNPLFFSSSTGAIPQRSVGSGAMSPRDNYASVRRENRELKLEVARMRMRLTDLEKDHISMKEELVKSHPAHRMLRSIAKKLSKLNAIFRVRDSKNSGKANSENRLFPKRRRHSVS